MHPLRFDHHTVSYNLEKDRNTLNRIWFFQTVYTHFDQDV